MRLLKFTPVFISATILAGCVSSPPDPTYRNNQNILGTWNCTSEIIDAESGLKTSATFDSTYVRSGISNSVGTLAVELEGLPTLEYAVATSATWEIQQNLLIETSTEVNLKILNHPQIAEQLNLEEMIPQNVSESYKILALGKSLFKIESELDGSISTCKRKNKS